MFNLIIWSIGLLILLLLVVLIYPIKINVQINRIEENDHILLEIFILRFIKLKFFIPFVKLLNSGIKIKEKDNMETEQEVNHFSWEEIYKTEKKISRFVDLYANIKYYAINFLRHVNVKKFEWRSEVGLGDAAETGIFVGITWIINYLIISLLSNFINLKTLPVIDVIPRFNGKYLRSELKCIITFSPWHTITAIFFILLQIIKKGGKNYGRSSNTRINEDCYGKS